MDFDTFKLALGLHLSAYVVLAVGRVIQRAMALATGAGTEI